jgi:hypothetical protein
MLLHIAIIVHLVRNYSHHKVPLDQHYTQHAQNAQETHILMSQALSNSINKIRKCKECRGGTESTEGSTSCYNKLASKSIIK